MTGGKRAKAGVDVQGHKAQRSSVGSQVFLLLAGGSSSSAAAASRCCGLPVASGALRCWRWK